MKHLRKFNENQEDKSEEREILLEIIEDFEKSNNTTVNDKDEVVDKLMKFTTDNMDNLHDLYDEYDVMGWEALMKELIQEIIDGVFDEEDYDHKGVDEMDKIYRKWLDEGDIMTDYGLMEWIWKNYTLTKK